MQDQTPTPQPEESIARQFGMFGLVLSSFCGASAVGVGLGWLLWKKAGFPWWILLVTTILGLYGATLQVIRYQKKTQGGVLR
ncbi:MAG: hypothetical protein H7301_00755 [Cryobacterium sp.]|nr:hypothetical protein [Oligoflexia bacterium]